MLSCISAVCSIIPSLVWAAVKGIYSNDYCWLVERGAYHWIIDGYRLLTLAINLILLIDILRVLWLKITKTADTTTYVKYRIKPQSIEY